MAFFRRRPRGSEQFQYRSPAHKIHRLLNGNCQNFPQVRKGIQNTTRAVLSTPEGFDRGNVGIPSLCQGPRRERNPLENQSVILKMHDCILCIFGKLWHRPMFSQRQKQQRAGCGQSIQPQANKPKPACKCSAFKHPGTHSRNFITRSSSYTRIHSSVCL